MYLICISSSPVWCKSTALQEFTELSGAQWPETQSASLPKALAVDAWQKGRGVGPKNRGKPRETSKIPRVYCDSYGFMRMFAIQYWHFFGAVAIFWTLRRWMVNLTGRLQVQCWNVIAMWWRPTKHLSRPKGAGSSLGSCVHLGRLAVWEDTKETRNLPYFEEWMHDSSLTFFAKFWRQYIFASAEVFFAWSFPNSDLPQHWKTEAPTLNFSCQTVTVSAQ